MQQPVQAAGLPWFAEDDYESFKAVLPDRHWHATFQEWEAAAQKTYERVTHQGIRAVKAEVRSDLSADWCRRAGRDINADALTAFGNEAAMRYLLGNH